MAGRKTHEQQLRTFERKDDYPNSSEEADIRKDPGKSGVQAASKPQRRQSEFPVSRQGMHQESGHNKHNKGGQKGHAPEEHGSKEEGK